MGINRFVYILFAVSALVLVWLGFTYNQQNHALLRYTAAVEHTYKVMIASQYCEKQLLDAETKQRGFLLTGDEHFREEALQSTQKIDSVYESLRQLTSDNPSQRVNLHLLQRAMRQRLDLMKLNTTQPLRGSALGETLKKGRILMNTIGAYISMIEQEEQLLLVERSRAKNYYQSLNFNFVKFGFFFACLVCAIAIFLIIRELRQRIRAQLLLEKTVLELRRSNEEVDQITFAASHDLQEPLRKISTLTTLLSRKMGDKVDAQEKDILERIERSTGRMQLQITDLVNFTVLLNTREQAEPVDLDMLFTTAIAKLQQADPTVRVNRHGTLPVVQGYPAQLEILFTQLLDNALRYKHPSRPLIINITYGRTEGDGIAALIWKKERKKAYHQITLSDNGLGFNNDFREKIFILFQTLHTMDGSPRKGMGLSLTRRIMANHYGYIEGFGEEDAGASFKMYFPGEDN